jgi:hypothetical protein
MENVGIEVMEFLGVLFAIEKRDVLLEKFVVFDEHDL